MQCLGDLGRAWASKPPESVKRLKLKGLRINEEINTDPRGLTTETWTIALERAQCDKREAVRERRVGRG
jgi:hypothetical protein